MCENWYLDLVSRKNRMSDWSIDIDVTVDVIGWQRVEGGQRADTALVDTEGQATLDQLHVRVDWTRLGRTMGVHRIPLYGYTQSAAWFNMEARTPAHTLTPTYMAKVKIGAVLSENFWVPGPWEVSTVERQEIQLHNNSRKTCIAEPKQSLHQENISENRVQLISAWVRPTEEEEEDFA